MPQGVAVAFRRCATTGDAGQRPGSAPICRPGTRGHPRPRHSRTAFRPFIVTIDPPAARAAGARRYIDSRALTRQPRLPAKRVLLLCGQFFLPGWFAPNFGSGLFFAAGPPQGKNGPLGGQRTSRSEGAWGHFFCRPRRGPVDSAARGHAGGGPPRRRLSCASSPVATQAMATTSGRNADGLVPTPTDRSRPAHGRAVRGGPGPWNCSSSRF